MRSPFRFALTIAFTLLCQAGDVDQLCRLQREILARSPAALARPEARAELDQRLGLLSQLIRANPRRAIETAFTPAQIASLGAVAAGRVEQHGVWEGELIALSSDDFQLGRARTVLRLAAGGETIDVFPVNPVAAPPACGARARLSGIRAGAVAAGELTVTVLPGPSASRCSPLGAQKVLVVPVVTPSFPTFPISRELVEAAYFGPEAPSLAHYWRETSAGRAWAEGSVLDPIRLDRDYDCTETGDLHAAVGKAIEAQPNLEDFSILAILFPYPSTGCSFGGLGSVGCWTASTSVSRSNLRAVHWIPIRSGHTVSGLAMVAAHEGGHNLGLRHASSMQYAQFAAGPPGLAGQHTEYGDFYSNMGAGFGHYNARQKRQLNWLDESDILTIDAPGAHSAETLASTASGPKALRILRDRAAGEYLWLESRTRDGYYESRLSGSPFDGALVHLESAFNQPEAKDYPSFTHLLDMTPATAIAQSYLADGRLASGVSWLDPFSALGLLVNRQASGAFTADVARVEPCVQLDVSSLSHGPGAESGVIQVKAPAGCRWSAHSSPYWIVVEGGAQERSGDAQLRYTLDANSSSRVRSGWMSIGRRPVLLRQSAEPKAPGAVQVSPETGTGSRVTLDADFTDPEGPEDLATLTISIGPRPGQAGSCTVEYDLRTATVRLLNDDASGWLGPVPANRASELASSACRLTSVGCYKAGGT